MPPTWRAHGWWRVLAVAEPRSLEVEDGFAHEDGTPDPDLPVIRMSVELEAAADGTRMTITSRFATVEQMEQVLAMGMVEGMTEALGQVDGLLAAGQHVVLLGDWNCDGTASPAVHRPATGQVWRFDAWPETATPLAPAVVSTGAADVTVRRSGGCDQLVVEG